MKNYEQMAQDVLTRIEMCKNEQRRRRQTAARAALSIGCACLMVVVSLLVPLRTPLSSSGGIVDPIGKPAPVAESVVRVVALSDGKRQTMDVPENLAVPISFEVRVTDLRGLTEAEVDEVLEADQEWMMERYEAAMIEYPLSEKGSGGGVRSGDVIVRGVRNGEFQVEIVDSAQVESIEAFTTTTYGQVEFACRAQSMVGTEVKPGCVVGENGLWYLHGQHVMLDGATYSVIRQDMERGEGDFSFYWKLAHPIAQALEEDSDRPLSSFWDELHFSIHYANGVSEHHLFVIRLADEGEVEIHYKGMDVFSVSEVILSKESAY